MRFIFRKEKKIWQRAPLTSVGNSYIYNPFLRDNISVRCWKLSLFDGSIKISIHSFYKRNRPMECC